MSLFFMLCPHFNHVTQAMKQLLLKWMRLAAYFIGYNLLLELYFASASSL